MITAPQGNGVLGALQDRESEELESRAGGTPDELARLVVLMIKLQLKDQRRLILELIGAGFSAHRIAALTGANYEAVRSTVRRQTKPVNAAESNTSSASE